MANRMRFTVTESGFTATGRILQVEVRYALYFLQLAVRLAYCVS